MDPAFGHYGRFMIQSAHTVDGERNSLKDHQATEHRCGAAAAAVSAGVISLKLYPSCSPGPHPVGKARSVCLSTLNRTKRKERHASMSEIFFLLQIQSCIPVRKDTKGQRTRVKMVFGSPCSHSFKQETVKAFRTDFVIQKAT